VLVVNPAKIPAKNAQELIALLKAKPGVYNYGSSGNGTILHLAAEMFLDEAGVKATHVPYKGVGPMLTDLIGGQVDFGTLSLPSVQQHLKNGALRAIGIGAEKRVAAAPEIPTFVEQGLPGYVVEGWFAVIGPARMQPADVARINAAFGEAFASPEVKEAMAKQGNTIRVSTPEYAAQFFPAEMAKYAKLVKKSGIEIQ
jgi:tripartite-type tricarboxylate transporter receptor subunit TctC